jgi:hypothetical protein
MTVVHQARHTALRLNRGSIAHRIRVGRLHRVHPGVYAVGHPILSLKGRFMAATFATGPGAVISHRSAAILHGLLGSAAARIDVTSRCRRSPGRSIRAHQTRTLAPQDVTAVDGIPVTSIARTLLDLTDVVPARHVERRARAASPRPDAHPLGTRGGIPRARRFLLHPFVIGSNSGERRRGRDRRREMRYMLLIYGDETTLGQGSEAEQQAGMEKWNAYTESLRSAGAMQAGEALQPTATATTVRANGGETLVTDGPFAETKEQLGGYYLLDVANLDEAIKWAEKCPGAASGSIELRPVMEFPDA